jgi:signal recognition particle subunit SRP68
MDITQFVASHREALQVGDHNAYRAQLSRQLLAARKRLGRATHKREKFAAKPITAEDIGDNHEFAHLLLLTSERAWAHAMHIKASHADDNAGKGITGTTRSHLISRLHKAAKTAGELVQLLQDQGASKSSQQNILEARAYSATLAGSEEFERQSEGQRSSDGQGSEKRWQKCLKNFSEARIIYAALLAKEKQELYRDVLNNTIDPTIRYAAYQAHLPRTLTNATVALRFFPKEDTELVRMIKDVDSNTLNEKPVVKTEDEDMADAAEIPSSIDWRGRKANIVDSSIGQALANVSVAEARLRSYLSANASASAKDKAASYDEILIASQDAADATKRATDELEKERVDEGDRRMQDLRVTSLSINYSLVSWRVGRNRILIGDDDGLSFEPTPSKPPRRSRKAEVETRSKEEPRGRRLAKLRERVVLYDAIIQSINSVKDLRGTMRDTKFVEELDSKAAYFRALKCVNISYSHSLVDNHVNALALLRRAQDLLSENSSSLQSAHSADSPPTLDVLPSTTDAAKTRIDSLVARMHAIVELHNHEQTSANAAAKQVLAVAPLSQHLDQYPAPGVQVDLKNLVAYPLKLEPVPVKPIFLDVAFNYIEYPGRAAVQVVKTAQPKVSGSSEDSAQPAPKKGWFGFGR